MSSIANAHGKSPAQAVLRWLAQRGVPVVVKSRDTKHTEENLALFDFSLADGEMASIDVLDTDRSQFGWW